MTEQRYCQADYDEFFIQQCPSCKNHFAFHVQYCYLCGSKVPQCAKEQRAIQDKVGEKSDG